MFKVKVLTIGKCKEEWLYIALKEYEKRLQGKVSIEWHLVKNNDELIECTKLKPYIALDPEGTLITSEAWAEKMPKLGANLLFVIGGATGLPKKILDNAQFIWSLSPLTFTHQITRLILIEQIYRAIEIDRNSQYHK